MKMQNITKVQEGLYTVESLPCPSCNETTTLEITGQSLFLYHKGDLVDNVLKGWPLSTRERFITGYCPVCWDAMWPDSDDDDEEDD